MEDFDKLKKQKDRIAQRDLDKKLGEARKAGYDMGLLHGRSEIYHHKSSTAIKAVILIDALLNFLDERYEFKKENY